jgi:hypothetical protein
MFGTSLNTQGIVEAAPGMLLVPTGGKVIYLHSSGAPALNALPPGMAGSADGFVQDINVAFGMCRDNRGDKIVVLPGHSQSVATATALSNIKAGVEVYGVGLADERPTFTWTAAASQWAISKANVKFTNCRLDFAGTAATTVTLAIDATAAAFELNGCEVVLAKAGGTQRAAIGVRYSSGSDRSKVLNCRLRGAADGAFTDGFLVNAAIDEFEFTGNRGAVGPAGANGVLRFAAAATNILVENNRINNILAGANSTAVFVGFAGVTGMWCDNRLSEQNDGVNVAQGIITLGNTRLLQNFGCDENARQGTQIGTAVAT